MTQEYDGPSGFILSDAAIYAFTCQDIFPDLLSFAVAIPDHLKSLFLIPVRLEAASSIIPVIASRVASRRYADAMPTGDTDAAEMFGTQTFVNYDNEPEITNTDEGSIFDVDEGWSGRTKHQETNIDQNIQVPTETTFMNDVDMSQYQEYPYRTKEKPVRHSSVRQPRVALVRLAIKPEALTPHTPEKIKNNASSCIIKLISYDKRNRIFTFTANCGNGPHTVRALLSEVDQVALNCDCKFWQYNGPEYHAKRQQYMLDPQHGTAAPPDVRDPDRKYWLCKHAYATLRRLDSFVQDVVEENWDLDDKELLDTIDDNWDRLEGVAEVQLDDIEEDEDIQVDWEDIEDDDLDIQVDWDGSEDLAEQPVEDIDIEEPKETPEEEEEVLEESDEILEDEDEDESED
jgi:hypothetical protein